MNTGRDLNRFAEQTDPRNEDIDRVRLRVMSDLDHRELRRERRTPVFAWGALAGAAAAALALMVWSSTAPRLPGVDEQPLAMVSEESWSELSPTREVEFEFMGKGSVRGTRQAPRVEWRTGTLRAAVEADRSIDLQVRTPDATVKVLGTSFEVERGAPGTTVTVERGRVRVECDLGTASTLQRGQRWTCMPTTGAGLLGRARHLQRNNAPAADILQSIELGRGRPDTPEAVLQELRFVKVVVLADSGRKRAALTEAHALLRDGAGHRHDELTDLVRSLRR